MIIGGAGGDVAVSSGLKGSTLRESTAAVEMAMVTDLVVFVKMADSSSIAADCFCCFSPVPPSFFLRSFTSPFLSAL